MQEEMLNELVGHAVSTTPWYGEKIKGAGRLRIEDLPELPILEKEHVQEFGESMISTRYARGELFRNASGGSTGRPTVIYQDHRRRSIRQVDALCRNEWVGWRLGEKFALLWGASRDLSTKAGLKERLRAIGSMNDPLELDAFDLDENKCKAFLESMKQIRPTLLVGYAGALARMAEISLSCGWDAASLSRRLKGIVSSAEVLNDERRELIAKAFKVPIFDRYGSREVGLIASECECHHGMHVNTEGVIVEVVGRDGKPVPKGTVGSIVVTDLHNFGMPLIRYRLGDRGGFLKGNCRCGRGYPLLGRIQGRESDFFVSVDGSEIHGEYFTHLFYGQSGIREFQFRQKKDLSLQVFLTGCTLGEDEQADLVRRCKCKLGEVEVAICHTDSIPRSSSGKHLFTIREN